MILDLSGSSARWEYITFLEGNGFKVKLAQNETVVTSNCHLETIFGLFQSGPALAYLNPENYSCKWDKEYKIQFNETLQTIIETKMGKNKTINIGYNRAFLLAEKVK